MQPIKLKTNKHSEMFFDVLLPDGSLALYTDTQINKQTTILRRHSLGFAHRVCFILDHNILDPYIQLED